MPVTAEALGKLLLKENYKIITQKYLNYLKEKSGYHPGIDYRARTPLKVYSPVRGKVSSTGAIGRVSVKIEGTNLYFIFLHLSKFSVGAGAEVAVGTLIGYTGSAGTSAPHLHVEARRDSELAARYFKTATDTGRNVNPTSVVNAPK